MTSVRDSNARPIDILNFRSSARLTARESFYQKDDSGDIIHPTYIGVSVHFMFHLLSEL